MATLVASSANAGLGVASTTCTVTVAATSPDTLLVLFIAANSFAVSSIAMGGGVWTQALNGTNNSNFTKAWIGRNVAAGTTTGTITFGGSTASGVQSQEWAGLTSVVGTNVPAFATSTAVSAGPTTPAWGQNVVLGMFVSNTGGVSGPSGGFTGLTPLVWTGTRNMASGYLIQTQPTAATIGWTITSGAWDCVLAGFQAYEDSAYDPVQSRRRRTAQTLRARFLRTWSEDTVAAVNAQAEVASGTGTAFGPSIAIAPNAGAPAGTGASNAPSISLAPNAGNGAGTGAAGGPSSSVAPVIQAASGTGSASSPAASIKATAGATSGTGAASSPSIALAPTAGAATGTGTSQAPSEALLVPAGAATGTGAANAPAVSIKATAGLASGTGAAANPAISLAPAAQLASGTGAALAPKTSIAPTVGMATGIGAAFDPAVSTSAVVSAAASLAAGAGTAFDPTVQTSIPTPVTGGQPPLITGALPPRVSGSARTTVPIGSAEILKPGV